MNLTYSAIDFNPEELQALSQEITLSKVLALRNIIHEYHFAMQYQHLSERHFTRTFSTLLICV